MIWNPCLGHNMDSVIVRSLLLFPPWPISNLTLGFGKWNEKIVLHFTFISYMILNYFKT